jgi:Patatin-like phospholipase
VALLAGPKGGRLRDDPSSRRMYSLEFTSDHPLVSLPTAPLHLPTDLHCWLTLIGGRSPSGLPGPDARAGCHRPLHTECQVSRRPSDPNEYHRAKPTLAASSGDYQIEGPIPTPRLAWEPRATLISQSSWRNRHASRHLEGVVVAESQHTEVVEGDHYFPPTIKGCVAFWKGVKVEICRPGRFSRLRQVLGSHEPMTRPIMSSAWNSCPYWRPMKNATPRLFSASILTAAVAGLLVGASSGCRYSQLTPFPTPAAAGFNTRDLIDSAAQDEADDLNPAHQLVAAAERLRKDRQQKLAEQSKKEGGVATTQPDRSILCLSGGGSFGAYSAGVLVGWSERGDRPRFDVVTGISTGALIAPCAFLGPKYDDQLKRFYTTLKSRDIYRLRPLSGLFGEAFADTSPLAAQIDSFLTAEAMQDLVEAHRKGRRLYIGTTEEEGKQFVVWDVGAMAARNGPGDLALIKKVLLGSSAAPGFFPSAKIEVSVDGVSHTERHVDGGVSQSLFFRPPYLPPGERSDVAARDLAGAKVYVILAGKLYADPQVIRPWSLAQAGNSVSTLIYAQTRGDLQRLYTICLLTGMDYYVSAIPPEYPAPTSSAEFKPAVMTAMFEEGRRVIHSKAPWRTLPPGVGRGESVLARQGLSLTYRPRGPLLPISGPKGVRIPPAYPISDRGSIPALPFEPSAK